MSKLRLMVSYLFLFIKAIFMAFMTIILSDIRIQRSLEILEKLRKDPTFLQLIKIVETSLDVSSAAF